MADATAVGGVARYLRERVGALTDRRAVATFTGRRRNLLGLVIVAGLGVVALIGPLVLSTSPTETALAHVLHQPSLAHPLGTDALGRDLLTRMVYGARISLTIAALVIGVRLVLGTGVGVVAGYAGGWVDEAAMRLVDVLLAFPGIVLALVVAGLLGPSLTNAMVALAVVGWGRYARVVRSEVISVKERGFVRAARMMGVSRPRTVARHVLPNVLGPVVVLATLDVGTVVLGAAGLSFLGLGAQPPTPEWGTMLASGRSHLQQAPWLINVPGVAIVVTVFGFNLLGDGLRDVLDPRQRTALEEVDS
ncbi:nickel transporter permease [Haloarculaceae archaeon H-GB2-1]|nr:ABC transporter permease [Haloarculaceae archaeon H-GB1-1]MEA5407840.1 nickel transporter permease [Haloarculaceae archaeon H-GB2-1]